MRLPGAVVALATGLLLTGCGIPVESTPRALDPASAPFRVFESPGAQAPQGPGRVALYFVSNDRVVFRERAVERSTNIEDLLALLLEGPTPAQIAEGTTTRLPASFTVESVVVGDNGVAVVNLGDTAPEATTPTLGYAQIVATLTAPGRARAVRFRADGVDVRVPRGDGLLTSEPLTREDYAELLALPSPAPAPASPAPTPSP